ncbi:hypothetical protein C3B55_00931 [Candidatus Pseudomonas adelgestsugas]|uniref:Uncharacterized protein n=1 Tax=Candidatus Pseudomonas adelgestsugas TaxID=1302376 RepID=A0ABX5R9L0_9PSED|nr:hypothetical protein C3B55_00931 [Candidatus Pseudomonas adelgestsugas]
MRWFKEYRGAISVLTECMQRFHLNSMVLYMLNEQCSFDYPGELYLESHHNLQKRF